MSAGLLLNAQERGDAGEFGAAVARKVFASRHSMSSERSTVKQHSAVGSERASSLFNRDGTPMKPRTRIPRAARPATAPGIDHLNSRQLLSTAMMPVHGVVLAHHHAAVRVQRAAVVEHVHSSHQATAIPATAPATSTSFHTVAQFRFRTRIRLPEVPRGSWRTSPPTTSSPWPPRRSITGTARAGASLARRPDSAPPA
jgi:hypothetical protein